MTDIFTQKPYQSNSTPKQSFPASPVTTPVASSTTTKTTAKPNTLKSMMDFAKANPNTDYAKTLFQHLQSGDGDAMAQKEGIDLSKFGRPALVKQETMPVADANPSVTNNNEAIDNSWNNGGIVGKVGAGLAKVGTALTTSEQNFGQDLGQTAYLLFGGQKKIDNITKQYMDNGDTMTALAKKQTDPALKAKYAKMAIEDYTEAQKVGGSIIGKTRTPAQIVGDALGVGADILLSGSYGKATAGMESFKLGEKAVTPVVKEVVKQTTGQVIKGIAKETGKQALKGGSIGYGMDVTQNLQSGKEGGEALKPGFGTALGVVTPLVIGGVKITQELLKNPDNAGKVINSLVKPLKRDFAYGKNPGQTVADMGITANSMDDLETKITASKKDIGSQLGELTKGLNGTVDLNKMTEPIDKAIIEANKSPRTNAELISRLQALKDDLLGVTENELGEKLTPDLSNISLQDAIIKKGEIGDMTKWTGNPSDDKIVNKSLKQVYGTIKGSVLNKVTEINPELAGKMSDLSEKYGGLISAENAIEYRNIINQRLNMVSMPVKVGSITGLITAVATGGQTIPAILVGVGADMLTKALSSTAFKTRLASWMMDESPTIIDAVYKANPAIRNILIKLGSNQQKD